MKLKMQCIKTYETIVPATELISTNMLTGETFSTGVKCPESRWTTNQGKIITVTKGESKNLIKSGNWQLIAA